MDAADTDSYNEAERTMTEDVFTLARLITENVEEFKNAYVSSIATITGARQSRRIKGVHTVTAEEYASGFKYDDSIARACHAIDIHLPGDEGQILKYPDDAGYIPFRCMLPLTIKNLIVAGRAVSADEDAFAALRVQAPCMEMGQAAGIAVSLCLADGIAVQEVDCGCLVERVRSEGSFV